MVVKLEPVGLTTFQLLAQTRRILHPLAGVSLCESAAYKDAQEVPHVWEIETCCGFERFGFLQARQE